MEPRQCHRCTNFKKHVCSLNMPDSTFSGTEKRTAFFDAVYLDFECCRHPRHRSLNHRHRSCWIFFMPTFWAITVLLSQKYEETAHLTQEIVSTVPPHLPFTGIQESLVAKVSGETEVSHLRRQLCTEVEPGAHSCNRRCCRVQRGWPVGSSAGRLSLVAGCMACRQRSTPPTTSSGPSLPTAPCTPVR